MVDDSFLKEALSEANTAFYQYKQTITNFAHVILAALTEVLAPKFQKNVDEKSFLLSLLTKQSPLTKLVFGQCKRLVQSG